MDNISPMRLSDFNYYLPKELVAQYPACPRGASRLLILDRRNRRIWHRKFADLIEYLKPGDCLVLNDSKVIPARLRGRKKSGAKVDLLLLEKDGNSTFKVLINSRARLKQGELVYFNGGALKAQIIDRGIVRFCTDVYDKLDELGLAPLPPYIKRKPTRLDRQRYQTVYARHPGSIACPTAGLHFTKSFLQQIRAQGVRVATITLHIGYSTFAPVREPDIRKHKMHPEYFKITADTAQILNRTKREGKRIIAVGTTVCRTLEASAVKEKENFQIIPKEQRTDLFIYPSYRFRFVDCLLTNFHLPKSSLFILVCAFASAHDASHIKEGIELVKRTYSEAIRLRYRFYSFGDAMLIV
jgi:S-adenosylmethionine:tRNA ribosyltransferase-isomerase